MKNPILVYALICLICYGCYSGAPRQKPPSPVRVAQLKQEDIPVYIEAIGNVGSLQVVQIKPQVSGKLLDAHVKQGQLVKKGDLLYTIDPLPYEAALEKARGTLQKDEATMSFAKKKMERYVELVKQDFVSQLTFDQYQSEYQAAQAQVAVGKADVEIAEINLNYCTITSPIDGMVSQFNIDPGNLVVANDPNTLTVIRQINPADIKFSVPQKDFQEIQKSMKGETLKFEVIVIGQPEKYEGEVYFIDNHLDLSTGTILLRGEVPNEGGALWPGEFVTIRMLIKTIPNAIMAPTSAVQTGQQGSYVYVVKPDMTVDYRQVTVGEKYNNDIVIEKGLALDETVVVDGQINLYPGAKIFISKN